MFRSCSRRWMRSAPAFPYFQIELRKGFFWFFFERNTARNSVLADSKFPLQKSPVGTRGGYLYRVRAHANHIALEMCHILTDGHGALIFFRTLLAEYYRLQGTDTVYDATVFDPHGSPEPAEWEDAFSRYADPGAPKPRRGPRAWHLPGLPLPVHTMRVTTGVISLAAALARAKEYGATLTVFLAAVYLAALQDVQDADPEARTAGAGARYGCRCRPTFAASSRRRRCATSACSLCRK